jgi:hypothetical protein
VTCRCSSPQEHASRAISYAQDSARDAETRAKAESQKLIDSANKRAAELAARSPNPDEYSIERVERIGAHLVMQVRYPSCRACAFEGLKTMVFLKVSEAQDIKWRRIDPHFRGDAKDHATAHPKDAPSPAARFPGTADGWADAVTYARGKTP